MIQLIAFIIFIVSAAVVLFILYRKIPVLIQLPQNGTSGIQKHATIASIEKKMRDGYEQIFSKQIVMHKILSLVKVWTLKAETKIDEKLHGIRKNAQEVTKKTRKRK